MEKRKRNCSRPNVEVLHKKFTSQTDAIIPKIQEVNKFLQSNVRYKNRLQERHPEVYFARLNEKVLLTSKHDVEGVRERAVILANYLPEVIEAWIVENAEKLKCNADDITDSICLAIVANLLMQGKTESIPLEPMMDDTGLLMQMVIPKKRCNCADYYHYTNTIVNGDIKNDKDRTDSQDD